MTEFTTWRSLVDGAEITDIPDSELTEIADHYWLLSEGEGTNVEDIEGTLDGTIEGTNGDTPTWVTDDKGYKNTHLTWPEGRHQDSQGVIAFGEQIFDSNTDEFTVSIWGEINNSDGSDGYMCDQGTQQGSGDRIFIQEDGDSDGEILFVVGGDDNTFDVTGEISQGDWGLISMTWGTDDTVTAYLNDSQLGTFSASATFGDATWNLGNSGDPANSDRSWYEGMGLAVVSLQEASSSQISDHYDETKDLYES